jgi:Ala-tRNA(Pro) deacylase
MVASRLLRLLDESAVQYTTIRHPSTFTSKQLAATLHAARDEIAKATIVRSPAGYAMAVLPASYQLDLKAMARAWGVPSAVLATEPELARLFPGCETGAIPPFGQLFGMPVYVDGRLTDDKWITFCAGRHDEAIKMSYAEYEKIVNPIVRELHLEPPKRQVRIEASWSV